MKVEYIVVEGDRIIFGGKRMRLGKREMYLGTCMNGKNSTRDLKRKFYKKYGFRLSNKILNRFIRNLKKNNLLAAKTNGNVMSKLSAPFKYQQLNKFQRSNIIEPIYTGLCYKNNPKSLYRDLKRCFASVDDYTLATLLKKIKKVRGIIVPHSNIVLSGPCASWAYKALTYRPKPDVFVILAPDHTSSLRYPFSILAKDFRLPLGVAKAERDLAKVLDEKCNFNIFSNAVAHIKEYSIATQLPFLLYLYRHTKGGVKILPILCAAEPSSKDKQRIFIAQRNHFLQMLKETIVKSGKNVIFVATGDLLHIDKWGGTSRFHEKNVWMIRFLEKQDLRGFMQNLDRGEQRSCGREVFYALFKLLGFARGQPLNYSWTSKSMFIKNNKGRLPFEQLIDIGYVSMIFY